MAEQLTGHLTDLEREAVQRAADVKERLVDFVGTPPFDKPRRRIEKELSRDHLPASHVDVIERLLFDFHYDDGSTVIDRFAGRRGTSDVDMQMAYGFLDGLTSFFEVLADVAEASECFVVRCCVSDLELRVVPTMRWGVPAMSAGTFLVGRMNPIAGSDLWTPSGEQRGWPADQREAVASVVETMAREYPELTHRNAERRQVAAEQAREIHERFVAAFGTDRKIVAAKDLGGIYSGFVASVAIDTREVEMARQTACDVVANCELADDDEVMIHSHPVARFGFYAWYAEVGRALQAGATADQADVERLRNYLDDPGVVTWFVRELVLEHLPTAEQAIARAIGEPGFTWEADGEALLASRESDAEPQPALVTLPQICGNRRVW